MVTTGCLAQFSHASNRPPKQQPSPAKWSSVGHSAGSPEGPLHAAALLRGQRSSSRGARGGAHDDVPVEVSLNGHDFTEGSPKYKFYSELPRGTPQRLKSALRVDARALLMGARSSSRGRCPRA